MKRILFTLLAIAAIALTASATDLTGKRIYVNPGHGSFGPNDRPMPTIPYPNLPSTGMPDTMGFYESNTDQWKCDYLGMRLRQSGAYVMFSRTTSGPWPYAKVDGDYPSYTYDDYRNRSDYEQYNRPLSEICEEVEAGNFDLFISVHSNAATEGTTTNFPLFLYRGQNTPANAFEQTCYNIGAATWPWRWEMFGAGFDYASGRSLTNMYLAGDWDFYGSHSVAVRSNGQRYDGYLGVLKHGTPGGLWEGYFHTYQPGRHRALNHDYCFMEGIGYYRGIMDYFGADPDTLGYICGTVKDMDKKMNHPLFKYAPKTNDQWVPCNGATVYLLNAAGDTLQNYEVDNLYNGVFAFYNLTPGVYHLAASCPGYESLADTTIAKDVVVTANHTTYPFLFLRDTAWAPAPVVYETYPDKSSGATGLDGQYNFGTAQTANFAEVVAGKKVRQVLVRDDAETYVLALDTVAHTSSIYKINTLTGALIQEVSTEGTQGQYYPVYNIAFTADSILVGCNFEECQFTPVGTFRTYYWNMEDLTAAPTQWFTSQWAGNFNNGEVGRTFAVAGAFKEALVFTDAQTTGSSHQFRVATMTTDQGNLVSVVRNQVPAQFTEPLFGKYNAIASPNADDHMIIAGENRTVEISFTSDAQAPTFNFDAAGAYGAGAMKYAGKSVIAAPVMANDTVTGVKMYNMTAGMSETAVTTTNIQLAEATDYCSVKPLADGKDIVVYVATATAIHRYTTKNQQQPTFQNIFAYDLKSDVNEGNVTLSFKLNTTPTEATVIISAQDGTEITRLAVADAQAGSNSMTVAVADLGELPLKWAVEASAPNVGNWAQVASAKGNLTRAFSTINVYPETETFGTIYTIDRAGANDQRSGLYVMNPDLTFQNTTAYKGVQSYYASPYRSGIASDGWVYLADWGDPHSGIYVIDPADPAGSHQNFFAGTQNSAGLWKNAAGVEEGSSTPAVYVYGTGADTKLLVYNEDPGSTLPTNGLCVYNIGQPDGTILHHWDGAPSAKMTFAGQANTNGNIWGCSHGVWVSQHRSAGNNVASATSLRFYTWDGQCTYASYELPVDQYDLPIIEGSLGSCFALTADEKQVILRGVDYDFMVFDIQWEGNTPVLSLAYRVKNNFNGEFDFLQMNWDYAGNLVCSGNAGVVVFAAPKDVNRCITPASALIAEKQMINNPIGADGRFIVKYDCETGTWADANPEIGETFTFAIDLTGSWLADFINADPARGLAINKWTSRGDVNINVARFKRISGDIWGMTVNFAQHTAGWAEDALMTDSVTTVYAQLFAFDTNGAWWLWDGHPEGVTTQAIGTDGLFQFAPSTGRRDADFMTADMEGSMYGYNVAGYAEPCATLKPVYPDHLWIIGECATANWNPAASLEMTKTADGVFEAVETITGSWFAFSASNGDWDEVNAARYGANPSGELIHAGTPAEITGVGGDYSFTIASGTYKFVVDLPAMTVTATVVDALENVETAKTQKIFENGQVYILRDGKKYTVTGTLIR